MLTLLLDLDDTLIANDIEAFIPRYLQAFAKDVSPWLPEDKFVSALWAGTREMLKNRNPERTLQEVFEASFFPAIEMPAKEFIGLADKFCAQTFPSLRGFIQPKEEAIQLVEYSLGQGYRLAIATNPLFPRTAVEQRLTWGGLPLDKYNFEVIASYETFHFTKSEPAYYAELLGKLNWPKGRVLMVGDDLEGDILNARRMSLPAFWLPKDSVTEVETPIAPSAIGKLADVIPWLEKAEAKDLHPDYKSRSSMLAILRATPAVLDSLSRTLADQEWTIPPQPTEWCLTEILCHLRDVDQEVNLPRIEAILTETNPFLPGKDTDPWAAERHYAQQDGRQALQTFISTRLKILDILESLDTADWERKARHAILGPTLLMEIVDIIAQHDRLHIQQVHQVREYLSSIVGDVKQKGLK